MKKTASLFLFILINISLTAQKVTLVKGETGEKMLYRNYLYIKGAGQNIIQYSFETGRGFKGLRLAAQLVKYNKRMEQLQSESWPEWDLNIVPSKMARIGKNLYFIFSQYDNDSKTTKLSYCPVDAETLRAGSAKDLGTFSRADDLHINGADKYAPGSITWKHPGRYYKQQRLSTLTRFHKIAYFNSRGRERRPG